MMLGPRYAHAVCRFRGGHDHPYGDNLSSAEAGHRVLTAAYTTSSLDCDLLRAISQRGEAWKVELRKEYQLSEKRSKGTLGVALVAVASLLWPVWSCRKSRTATCVRCARNAQGFHQFHGVLLSFSTTDVSLTLLPVCCVGRKCKAARQHLREGCRVGAFT